MRAIVFTRSSDAASQRPKIVWRPLRWGVSDSVTKNCDPLVLGPLLAIARSPPESNRSAGDSSSGKRYPGSPVPVPVGSPIWIMNSGITRCTSVSSKYGPWPGCPERGST